EGDGQSLLAVAVGGNFYAIVEPQEKFSDVSDVPPSELIRLSARLRAAFNARHKIAHPENPAIDRVTHIMWTGKPRTANGSARNAVFYGEKAIDRSPCGTGTSARMAQLAATGRLKEGETSVHESIIGSTFVGRIEGRATVGNAEAIIPSIEGWARVTGLNTIIIDDRDPFAHGFQVKDSPCPRVGSGGPGRARARAALRLSGAAPGPIRGAGAAALALSRHGGRLPSRDRCSFARRACELCAGTVPHHLRVHALLS